jgi:aspartyl-tRNA(Asn)/glutamyl-tRNA(Gln) amidotransferase subunit C
MSLDNQAIKNLAILARLNITDEALPSYTQKLSNILELAEQLKQVDTKGISPMAHPFAEYQRLREDVADQADQSQQLQSIAPSVQADLYLVPQVIEQE